MIQLEDAKAAGFANSTRIELRHYATELGIDDLPDNADSKTIKTAIMKALGMTVEQTPDTPQRKVVTSGGLGSAIFPSYNLTPSGVWGGRRHRLSIPRPEGSKLAQAEGFDWNGKHTFYIPYDEVTSVPEPIYQLLITNKRRRAYQQPTRHSDGSTEITTAWAFDSLPMNYSGVDQETRNRAGSLMEWYQSRGSEWFEKLTFRQLALIADKCEVSKVVFMGVGVPPRALNDDELRGRLLEFFFGFADAQVDPQPEIED